MRNRYIVAYDISDTKRLRKVFNAMRGFGDPLQYSVFMCELSLKEKAMMVLTLIEIIHYKEDRIMIVDLGWNESDPKNRIEFIGKTQSISERSVIVV
jgi:CRISPR-associated protein Cas2